MRRFASALIALIGCSAEAPPSNGMAEDGEVLAPFDASDLAITEVALFQTVKFPLLRDGAAVKNTYASIVGGRPSLLRVFVQPGPNFHARLVTAEITLIGSTGTIVRQVNMKVSGASTDSDLTSTINLALAEEDLPAGSWQLKVRLGGATLYGVPFRPSPQFPVSGGSTEFTAVSSSKLRIVLVPVRYDADGSGRLPDTSQAAVEQYRRAFFETYPASAVDISVRSPMPWSAPIGVEIGWDEVLEQVIALRAKDRPTVDTYYLGLFRPDTTFATYCGGSCTTGQAPRITDPRDSTSRAGVAVSYTEDPYDLLMSLHTALHETGHLHGRSHVESGADPSCGTPSRLDRAFPHTGGLIGDWGYGVLSKKLYSPDTYLDFMGYCSDTWVSDYTYGALLARVQATALLTKQIVLPGGEYRFVHVSGDGDLRWGATVNFPATPTNNPVTVRALDTTGAVHDITGYYFPYGDGGGGYMLVRKSEVNGKHLELDIRGASRVLAAD